MKKVLIFICLVVITIAVIFISKETKGNLDITLAEVTDINYQESLKELTNPERGFYEPIGLNMSEANNKILNPTNNLVHLRVGIGAFSSSVNGEKDLEFTDDMLKALDATLKNIKNNGGSVIIRFAYDNFNGIKDLEPSMDMILTHINQLKEVFYANKDVIAYVELGFFGPWGEMHTSSICNNENVSKAIDAMLLSVPENIKIGVRTPAYYASWANLDLSTLDENIPTPNSSAYRIGLYNDGYLGSESDLGTYKNREIETNWLKNQAMHTFFGGEIVANYANGEALNTVAYLAKEGFITHTTYLNLRWNNTVIESWKNEIYEGEDELYRGLSGFLYINNHLGYRYVLKSSKLSNIIQKTEHLVGEFTIENVGFGNLINEKKVSIILTNDDATFEIDTEIDPRTWNSKETTSISYDITLPEDIKEGNYKVYLRISQDGNLLEDNNYNCIEFANDDIWNEELGANYIGSVDITIPHEEESGYDDYKEPTTSENETNIKDNIENNNDNELSDDEKNDIENEDDFEDDNSNLEDDDILYVEPPKVEPPKKEETSTTTTTTKAPILATTPTTKETTQSSNRTTAKNLTTSKESTKKTTTTITSTTATSTITTKANNQVSNATKEKSNKFSPYKVIIVVILILILLVVIWVSIKKLKK